MFSEEMKGKLLPVARECLRIHMQAIKKVGEEPDARDLWFAKCMAARKLEEIKNRTDEDRLRDEVIREEAELMAKRIQVAKEKGNSGVACETQVGTNKDLPEAEGQEATRRPDRSDLPLEQDGRPARINEGRHKRTDQRGESLKSHYKYLQKLEEEPQEAPPRYERFAGLDGDHGELEDIPDDPKDASLDDLQALHVQKDQLYEAQEDYYCALRLQILARYQRMHMRYLRDIRAMRTRKNEDVQDVEVPIRGNGRPNEKSAKSRCTKRRRTSSPHLQPQKAVDETFEQDQSDIEDRISFYNFGYAPEDEHLTREEEIQLLPFDIDIAEIHAKRYELRDRFPGGCKNSDTSLIASGRAFYAARRLKLWKMRQDAAAGNAQVEAESQ
ncbi:hypothetical protein J4E89_004642 [Alternaria sp. Ai002NY15]|nr:hypothetical protein J4E89_004642 [Alternaria sp. Ai002NY15]